MDQHDLIADRLLHQAGTVTDPAERAELVARAAAHAALAAAQARQLGNLIAAARYADELEHPLARLILLRNIRRRLGLFPPLTADGQHGNGGD